jgi:hypothetical protein
MEPFHGGSIVWAVKLVCILLKEPHAIRHDGRCGPQIQLSWKRDHIVRLKAKEHRIFHLSTS